MREIGLIEQKSQNDYSKAYILTMENKLKELENSNRLLKMEMLSQYGLDSNTDNTVRHFQDSPRPCASPDPAIKTNNSTSGSELHARKAHIELWLLESRIAILEQYFSSYSYSPYWTPYNYQAYHNPYPFYHNSSTQYYYPWACAGEHSHYTPHMHEAHYPYYCGSKQHILTSIGIQPSKALRVNTCSAYADTPCPALDISLQILKWQLMGS